MTMFEEFAQELKVEVKTDEKGLYTGMTKALANLTTDVILSDDDTIFHLGWEKQKELIKEKFYKVFPYMKEA